MNGTISRRAERRGRVRQIRGIDAGDDEGAELTAAAAARMPGGVPARHRTAATPRPRNIRTVSVRGRTRTGQTKTE